MCCVFILDFSISMPPHTYELTIYSILFILVVVLIFLVGAGTILLKCSKMFISWMPSFTKGSPCQAKQKEQFHGDKIDQFFACFIYLLCNFPSKVFILVGDYHYVYVFIYTCYDVNLHIMYVLNFEPGLFCVSVYFLDCMISSYNFSKFRYIMINKMQF